MTVVLLQAAGIDRLAVHVHDVLGCRARTILFLTLEEALLPSLHVDASSILMVLMDHTMVASARRNLQQPILVMPVTRMPWHIEATAR